MKLQQRKFNTTEDFDLTARSAPVRDKVKSVTCTDCSSGYVLCCICNGIGSIDPLSEYRADMRELARDGIFVRCSVIECTTCHGTGKLPCRACNGKKFITCTI